MVPLLVIDEDVAEDKMEMGSPFLPLPASLETVTPEFIVTLAPVFNVNGLEAPPAQLELTTRDEVTVVPPLHRAHA